MIYLDIETAPNPVVFSDVRAWRAYTANDPTRTRADDALHPAFGMVVCVVAETDGVVPSLRRATSDENDPLRSLAHRLNNPVEVLCGHNIKGFDIPFLGCRYLANGLPVPPALAVSGKKPWEVNHVDTMELLRFGAGKPMFARRGMHVARDRVTERRSGHR